MNKGFNLVDAGWIPCATENGFVEVLHGWGGSREPGFYSTLVQAIGRRPETADGAARRFGTKDVNKKFDFLCQELKDGPIPEMFDAILIDEGQDVPASFYRLALKSLREPKRLYWAYDEAQGIGSLVVPTAKMVFGEKDGKSLVDLSGIYVGGINKSPSIKRCFGP